MSPDIPEPMDIDTASPPQAASVLRSSHSPPMRSETFGVSPMAIMQPSNPAEKAAYTDYHIEHPASPPPPPLESPEHIADSQEYEEELESYSPHNNDADADTHSYLGVSSPDDHRRSADSFEFSTTPGPSSTDPSSGRTPDRGLSASLSPMPPSSAFPGVPSFAVKQEPESSASPEATGPSSSSGLQCDKCGRSFDHLHQLNHHRRYHDRKHACPYNGCDRRFGTKTHLERHVNDIHLKSKAYHCTDPGCAWYAGGKSFPRKDNWRRHMMNKHKTTTDQLNELDRSLG